MAQPGRSSSPSCTSWLASTAPPVPSQPGGGGHRLPALESTRCPSRGGRRLRASPVLCFSTCTRSRRRRCGSHAPASPTTCSMRGRESSPPAHTAVRGPFGTPTSRRGGATPVTFSGTQPVEPDPILRPVWLSRHKPSGSRPSRPLLIPVQSHRRPAPGLRPTERVLGADSVRAVVPPGVTSLVRLTYGLAARERLGTGCQPRVSR